MAAPSTSPSDSDSSSSGSDAEELSRCREAATPAWGWEQRPRGPQKPRADAGNNPLPATPRSLRHRVDEHEQDGNELQTTPEFRAHVAKKLRALLDSSITISEVEKEPRKAQAVKAAAEDDGFRLFFTSIPGHPDEEAPAQSCRKPPPPSSSEDSDEEWQRCQEAAVSACDILQGSAIHSPVLVEEKEAHTRNKQAKEEARANSATITTGTALVHKPKKVTKLSGGPAALGTKKKKKAKTPEAPCLQPAKSASAVLSS
ncbi:protein CUSTOS isoform X2 [Echinops telfairi]|uniref:Protein CUSTOS isoform X2 n=1 Tax=Echinops telfairi TaxID=9371 RepID=A0AC55DLU6_ECHTE|nr:protein CUSTOS isoform X2 [Echinops telfairi]